MNERKLPPVNMENVAEICARIKKEADAEVSYILNKANKEAVKIIEESKKSAGQQKEEVIFSLEKELGKTRERIYSTLNLEKKRIVLEEKTKVVEQVIEQARQMASKFRQEKGYAEFLQQAVLEGIKVIGTEKAVVLYSSLDKKLIHDQLKNKLPYMFQKGEFSDIGVIVQSSDGRLIYDNRFEARLKREYDDLYMRLLREAF